MNMFKKNGGFTLVELIVVIAILAILAGVAVPAYSGYITKANEAADMTMLDSIKTAIVFDAVDKDPGHDCTVTGATVGTNAKSISVTGTKMGTDGKGTSMNVDVSAYIGADTITYKSGATGASWNGTQWTLTFPAGK